MAEKVQPVRITSGKKKPPSATDSQPGSPAPSRPGSGDTHLATNPGEIVEETSEPAQHYNTFVDNRPQDQPEDDDHTAQSRPPTAGEGREPMAGQAEIDFPTDLQNTATPQPGNTLQPDGDTVADSSDKGSFESLNPADYGIDMEDESEPVYEPPQHDDSLPDLYRLMASLDEGVPTEDDPIPKDEPPSLFSRPENIDNYKKITDLRLQVEDDEIENYIRQFEDGVRDDVLLIGNIGLEDVQEEEKKLRDEHVQYMESEALREEERKRRIKIYEEHAKKRAAYALWKKRKEIQRMDQLQQQKERLMLDRLQKSFRRSENQLILDLERRKGEVKTYFGDLMTADGHYGGSRGRRWKVDWDKTPQPVQIKLKCLRGLKDKVPGGRYVMMVSLYNRLGGHVMRWSNLKGQQWGGATLPVTHDGHFYNIELKLDQSVFTVLPARPGVRPGMVIVFELFLLRGAVVNNDRVVAWGAFPIADGKFEIIEGTYKCPLLRGEMDHRIEKHDQLEGLMASDLDHWMSNLYFEVVKLPRFLAGQKEYEVELQFSSGILAYPDRVHTGEDVHDGDNPVPGSLPDVHYGGQADADSRMTSDLTMGSQMSITNGPGGKKAISNDSYDSIVKPPLDGSMIDVKKPLPRDSPLYTGKKAMFDDSLEDLRYAKMKSNLSYDNKEVGVRQRRPYSTIGSRAIHTDQKIKVCDETDSEEDENDDTFLMKRDKAFFPVKGKDGLFYKKEKSTD